MNKFLVVHRFILIALMLFAPAGYAKKVGLIFNGGGSVGEGPKNNHMEQESITAAQKLKKAGYDLEGNVFITNGLSKPGVDLKNQEARKKSFLDRLETVCQSAAKGDEIFISFSGHGLESEDGDLQHNSFLPYVHATPTQNDWEGKLSGNAKVIFDAVRPVIRAYLESCRGTPPHCNPDFAKGLAKQSGLSERAVDEMLTRGIQEFDSFGPKDEETSKRLAYYLATVATDKEPKSDRKRFSELFQSAGDELISMSELKPIIETCTKNGARVRATATNCFSGGLLSLTDPKGLFCALTATNPHSTSVYTDEAGNQSDHMEGNKSLAAMKNEMEFKSANTYARTNMDPNDSTDFIISGWIDNLITICSGNKEKASGADIQHISTADLCKALGDAPPSYYSKNGAGLVSGGAPKGVQELLKTKSSNNKITSSSNATSPDAVLQAFKTLREERTKKFLEGIGIMDALDKNIRTRDDLIQLVERSLGSDWVKRFKKESLAFLQKDPEKDPKGSQAAQARRDMVAYLLFSALVKSANEQSNGKEITEEMLASDDEITTKRDVIVSGLVQMITALRTQVFGKEWEANPDLEREKKEAYRKLFEKFASGISREKYENAKKCVESPLSGETHPSERTTTKSNSDRHKVQNYEDNAHNPGL